MNLQLIGLRIYFGIFSFISPKKAAKKAFGFFQKVRKKDIRPREESFFKKANKFTVEVDLAKGKRESIHCFELGEKNNPLVLLVHGWDSNAGSMSQLANKMVELKKRVVLFNLPAHAMSKYNSTNIDECRRAFEGVVHFLQPTAEFSILSHSFGSAVVTYGLSKLDYSVDRLVFLTSPNKLTDIFTDFKQMIGLSNKSYSHLLEMTYKILGEPLENIAVADKLAKIKFNDLLLIHDKADKVLPYKNALEIKKRNANAKLITFDTIGHYKMLWNKDVLNECASFIQG